MNHYLDRLAQFIRQKYGFCQVSLAPAPRGFFGETWVLNTERGKYLVKIDYWGYHKDFYRQSFPVMEHMLQSGIDFIPEIAKGTDGQLCFPFQGGILGIFQYIEGIHTEEYPIGRLFRRLARVYRIPAEDLGLQRDNFSTSGLVQCGKRAAELSPLDPVESRIIEILSEKEDLLKRKEERLLKAAEICRQEPCVWVLTHGDAGGNCIITPQKFTIIDWDRPMIAPPERDTWFFMHRDEQVKEIESAFAQEGFDYQLNFHRFAYYCYDSLFYYLGEYLGAMRERQGKEKERLAGQLEEYLRSSWIFEQLGKADTISLNAV